MNVCMGSVSYLLENKLMKLLIFKSIDINSIMIKYVKRCRLKMMQGEIRKKKRGSRNKRKKPAKF